MIIFDMSNVVFSIVTKIEGELSTDMLRHTVLTRIAYLKKKLKSFDDGTIVLAYDSKDYWRRDVSEFYKKKRKESRDKSSFDWESFFPMYNQIIEEFKNNLPFISLQVDRCEADDIMAVISKYRSNNKPTVIVSSDTDMLQLRSLGNIYQYTPSGKHARMLDDEPYSLMEHIIRGDRDDGIPNVLSSKDCLVNDVRQRTITKKMYDDMIEFGDGKTPSFSSSGVFDRYKENVLMIDFEYIPQQYIKAIVDQFDQFQKPKGKLSQYCFEHKLTKFMASGGFQ